MNKMIKGSVAGATGVVLLMGGFGTYALWSDTATLPGSTVASGTLDIDSATATWADTTPGATNTSWSPATDRMVPGDVVKRTQVFTVVGTGKNLRGRIDFTQGTVTNPTKYLTVAVDVTSSSATVTKTAGTNNFVFAAPFGTATLTAVVTYTLPSSVGNAAGESQIDQNQTVTLPDSSFTISQTALPAS